MSVKLKIMKRWKRWTLLLLGLLLLSQSPFIYRRFELRRLSQNIRELDSQRVAGQAADDYTDYKGVIHVHSQLGGHSTGGFQEIIDAARRNQLAFVVMTEHPSGAIDTSAMTLKGLQGGVLFVNGNELVTSDGDRLLVMPGSEKSSTANTRTTQQLITEERTEGKLLFVAYPQEFRNWDARDYHGIEVYNLYTNARRINPLLMFFDGLWSYGSYGDLLFARFYERPVESLKRWDEITSAKKIKLVALAGNDAHANIGVKLGDAGGKKYFEILLDPYERSFRIVRNHVLIEKDKALDNETLLEAIRNGHSYISFDLFSDATGFRFTAENENGKRTMGDQLPLGGSSARLRVVVPLKSRVRLIRDGRVLDEAADVSERDFQVTERGVYRIEVYLDQLGSSFRNRPWIISNPIYVE